MVPASKVLTICRSDAQSGLQPLAASSSRAARCQTARSDRDHSGGLYSTGCRLLNCAIRRPVRYGERFLLRCRLGGSNSPPGSGRFHTGRLRSSAPTPPTDPESTGSAVPMDFSAEPVRLPAKFPARLPYDAADLTSPG